MFVIKSGIKYQDLPKISSSPSGCASSSGRGILNGGSRVGDLGNCDRLWCGVGGGNWGKGASRCRLELNRSHWKQFSGGKHSRTCRALEFQWLWPTKELPPPIGWCLCIFGLFGIAFSHGEYVSCVHAVLCSWIPPFSLRSLRVLIHKIPKKWNVTVHYYLFCLFTFLAKRWFISGVGSTACQWGLGSRWVLHNPQLTLLQSVLPIAHFICWGEWVKPSKTFFAVGHSKLGFFASVPLI